MGLSIWHIVLFAVVVILLFGTSKLKNLGKDLGGAIKDFKDTVNDESPKITHESKPIKSIQNSDTLNDKTTV